jgi:hypothetical protein
MPTQTNGAILTNRYGIYLAADALGTNKYGIYEALSGINVFSSSVIGVSGFTGSLFGTASWASNTLTASNINFVASTATSASWVSASATITTANTASLLYSSTGNNYIGGFLGIGPGATSANPTLPYLLAFTGSGGVGVLSFDNGNIIEARNSVGTYEAFLYPRWSDNVTYMNYGGGGFNLRTSQSLTTIFCDNSQQVGIGGVTSPSATLHVTGAVYFARGSSTAWLPYTDGIHYLTAPTIYIRDGAGGVYATFTGTALVLGGAISTTARRFELGTSNTANTSIADYIHSPNWAPTGNASAATWTLMQIQPNAMNSGMSSSFTALNGILLQPIHGGTGQAGSVTGISATVRIARLAAAQCTNAYVYTSQINCELAGGAITNSYHLYMNAPTATGTMLNRYGIYQVGTTETNVFASPVSMSFGLNVSAGGITGSLAGTASYATTASYVSRSISRGGTIYNPSGISTAVTVPVWTAPYACTVTAVKGYRISGSSATINAHRSGSATNHLATDLTLTNANAWTDGGAVQDAAYAAGDGLEIKLTSYTGAPTQISIQVNLTR